MESETTTATDARRYPPFYEFIHIQPSVLRIAGQRTEGEDPTIYSNMAIIEASGAEVHLICDIGPALNNPTYPPEIMPDPRRQIILGGGIYDPSEDPNPFMSCVNDRLAGWQRLGYDVVVDPNITLYPNLDWRRPITPSKPSV